MEIREINAKKTKKNEIHEPKIDEMNKKFKCTNCEYRTDRNTLLRMHTESLHMKLVRWRCSSCDYKSYHKSMMDYHRKRMHCLQGNALRIGCKSCEQSISHTKCKIKRETQKNTGKKTHETKTQKSCK